MKKCPSCEKTFDDAMRFCQVCGTPLVEDVPFDPYATIVGSAASVSPPPQETSAPDEPTPSESAISVPNEAFESQGSDPLKTMYVSDSELKEVLGAAEDVPVEKKAEEVKVEAPVAEQTPLPEPPPPSFSSVTPPPSPYSAPPPVDEQAVPAPPVFLESQPPPTTEKAPSTFEAASTPPPAPVQEWTPPPSPNPSGQAHEAAASTPFQPLPGGQNKTLAIISLVCGVLSLFCCSWFIPGIAAIVLGFIARSKASSDPANYGGAGLALGGLITGAISIVLGIVVIVLYFLGAFAGIMGGAVF